MVSYEAANEVKVHGNEGHSDVFPTFSRRFLRRFLRHFCDTFATLFPTLFPTLFATFSRRFYRSFSEAQKASALYPQNEGKSSPEVSPQNHHEVAAISWVFLGERNHKVRRSVVHAHNSAMSWQMR
jgi:hypothetical protein